MQDINFSIKNQLINWYLGPCCHLRHFGALSDPSDRIYGHFIWAFGPNFRLSEMYFLGHFGLKTLENHILRTPSYPILVATSLSFDLSHNLRNLHHF